MRIEYAGRKARRAAALHGRLEAAATTASEAAARRAPTTGEAGAAGAARRGGHGAAGLRGHVVEVVDEIDGIEIGAVRRAAVPRRRFLQDSLESLAPIFLDAQGHGEGQELFKHL